MPITKLDTNDFTQVCAHCGAQRSLSLDELQPSDEDATGTSPLRVPTCPACGTVELLIPTQVGAPPHPDVGSYGHLHQLLVDKLNARRSDADSDAAAARTQALQEWFPEGLVLAAPPRFHRSEAEAHSRVPG